MRIGIIGLPASGKSTVYRLLTHGQPSHQAGQLGEASIAVVKVPDPRLERLALMFKPKKGDASQRGACRLRPAGERIG